MPGKGERSNEVVNRAKSSFDVRGRDRAESVFSLSVEGVQEILVVVVVDFASSLEPFTTLE